MEFHEKLQQLRKGKNMTQQQLADMLYVSRTAVSKWESGKGYPNIESLKRIAQLFDVSVDQLLSDKKRTELAERGTRRARARFWCALWGALDLLAGALACMPLFGQREGAHISSVPLFMNTEIPPFMKGAYYAALTALFLLGAAELALHRFIREKGFGRFRVCSLALHTAAALLFALSRQPYATGCLLLLMGVKAAFLITGKPMK